MRRPLLGTAALLSILVSSSASTTSIALAEPPGDAEGAPRMSVPVGLRAEAGRSSFVATSPDGFTGSMRVRLASATLLVVPDPSTFPSLAAADPNTATSAIFEGVSPPSSIDRVGIGRTVKLGHGRVLVMDLTPSPAHCAPLVSLTF